MGRCRFSLICYSSTNSPCQDEKTIPRLLESNKKRKERDDKEERKFYFVMMYMCTSILFLVYQEMLYFGNFGLVRNMVSVVRVMQPYSFDREVNFSIPYYLESFVI